MLDYYGILGIAEEATTDSIKKAFRKKLKKHHPDVHEYKNKKSLTHSSDNLIDIIDAYNVLSNPIRRRQYDNNKRFQSFSFENFQQKEYDEPMFERRKKKTFNYENFLNDRMHLWEYRLKFFVYDLVYKNAKRAVSIYEEIQENGNLQKLRKDLGFWDYYDCLFLLAEYYQNTANSANANKAIQIFFEISELENEMPYFKSYMEEVAERVFLLYKNYNDIDTTIMLPLLDNMLDWEIPTKYKKKAHVILAHNKL